MTHQLEHQIVFTLKVTEIGNDKPGVWAVVRKPESEEGATSTYPYAVWVADNNEDLKDSSKRLSPCSSVETLGYAVRMYFTGRASYKLGSGLSFTLDELTECKDDNALLELIQSRS